MNHTAFFDLVKKGTIGDAYLMEGPEEYIKQQALKDGMQTLRANAVKLVLSGTTSYTEILSVSYEN